MPIKRFLYYFTWTVIIGVIIFAGLLYQLQLMETAAQTYEQSALRRFVVVFPVVIGLLLRLPKFILEVKEKKINSFDWSKFIAVGVPAFILLLMLFLLYLPPMENSVVFRIIASFSISTIPTIAGIVFGYVLLDSFRNKVARDN